MIKNGMDAISEFQWHTLHHYVSHAMVHDEKGNFTLPLTMPENTSNTTWFFYIEFWMKSKPSDKRIVNFEQDPMYDFIVNGRGDTTPSILNIPINGGNIPVDVKLLKDGQEDLYSLSTYHQAN